MNNEIIAVDVQTIMFEIREEIKFKGYTSDMLSFEDVISQTEEINDRSFSFDEFNNYLAAMNSSWKIQPYSSICGNPIVVILKRIIRRITRFIVLPIAEFQSEYNVNTVRAVNQISRFITDEESLCFEISRQLKRNEKLMRDEVNTLRDEYSRLAHENETLKSRIEKLENLLSCIEK